MNATELKVDLENELARILEYWMRHTPDHKYGGYLGELTHDNIRVEGAPKSAILHARILWTFSSAYLQVRKPEYLEEAKRAFEYFNEHFVDAEFGGVYWELDANSKVKNPRKQIYAISFAIYGMTEYFRACGDAQALEVAKALFQSIEANSFDAEQNGYFEAFSREWGKMDDVRLSDKDENAQKTMNTHLHILEAYTNLYRVWKDEKLAAQIKNLIEVFLDIIIQKDFHFGLFFDENWGLSSRNVSYGHDIEGSWLIFEAAEVLGNEVLIERVKPVILEMAKAVAEQGLSKDFAVLEELHVATGEQDPTRHWWPQAEGIVGFYNAYELTKDEKYLDLSTRVWQFTKSHLLDLENGEWFWKVDEEGNPVKDESKVGFWKCPYHNGRSCLEIMNRVS